MSEDATDSDVDESGGSSSSSSAAAPAAPTSKPRRPRPRRARLSLKAKQARAAALELAKLERHRAREAAQAAKLAELQASMAKLVELDAEERRQQAALTRPATVVEYCRANGYPLDVPYHPRYTAVGIPPDTDEQTLESVLFGAGWPTEYGGLGGYGHLRNFIDQTWPWWEWNPWCEQTMRVLADDDYAIRIGDTKLKFVNLTGPGSASKTASAGVFACAWFMVDWFRRGDPRTSVTLTSTSKGIINQRVWPIIQRCFHEALRHPGQGSPPVKLKWGHMVDSQKMVLAVRRDGTKDAKHSICALAVESGELSKAVDKIKGRHTERMLLIVDEANSTPQAILDCIPNMLTSVRELIVLIIGNALSRLDPHGLCCTPAKGWKAVTINDNQWDTLGVARWGIGPGVCIHFDGSTSPNVLAGRTLYKHIYSYERWQHVLHMGDEYRNTLQHWSQDRGFWPPDSIQTTIFSEAMVISHDGTGRFNWLSEPRPCAALDPAFGGDACVLRRGALGEIAGGRQGLQLQERLLVPFDPESPHAIDYQIATYVIAKCKEWRVEPHLFGLDATGIGRGVAAFIQQLWSPRIVAVEFGGAASDLPAGADDMRSSHEIYHNAVTELWYSCRDVLLANQLKGLDAETIKQFCTRIYEFQNRRYKVEKKDDMKLRLGYSPDDADTVAVLVAVGRRNGLVATPFARQQRQLVEDRAASQLDGLYESSYTEASDYSRYADVTY